MNGEEKLKYDNSLPFSNIPIYFNKLIRPACFVDSVNLLIFRKTLLDEKHDN